MSGFWKRQQSTDLENALRRGRPVPRNAFVAAVARSIDDTPRLSRMRRVGAAALAGGVAILAIGFGWAGYAYSTSSKSSGSMAGVHLNQTGQIQRPDSSSHAQYGPVPVPPHPKPKPTPPPPPPPPPPPAPPTGSGTNGSGQPGTGSNGSSGQPPASSGTAGETTAQTSGNPNESTSGLPFTGVSLVFPVLLGAVLIGLGIVLRRRGRAID